MLNVFANLNWDLFGISEKSVRNGGFSVEFCESKNSNRKKPLKIRLGSKSFHVELKLSHPSRPQLHKTVTYCQQAATKAAKSHQKVHKKVEKKKN